MPPQQERIKIWKSTFHYGTIYVLYDSNYGDVMAAETSSIGEPKTVEFSAINPYGLPTHYIQKYTKFLIKRILEENPDFSLRVYVDGCNLVSEAMEKELTCIGFTTVTKDKGRLIGTLPKRTIATQH